MLDPDRSPRPASALSPGSPDPFFPAERPDRALRWRRWRFRQLGIVAVCVLLAAAVVARYIPPPQPTAAAQSTDSARIVGNAPSTWDPAIQSDAETAATLAQVYEGLTAFDVNSQPQPALARSWRLEEGGRRIVFELRENLRFSDGSPLDAEDVVASWLRLLDPAHPSPLSSLLSDITGATDYLRGEGRREDVGIRADGRRVVVDFHRPASYFAAVAASPSLAVVPSDAGAGLDEPQLPEAVVFSGAYQATSQTDEVITLRANPNYWAGEPPIKDIELITDLGGRSPVEAFEAGDVDYTQVFSFDASWIRYDAALGPQLRRSESLSVTYYGFDTAQPPFDDPRVRRAFAQAVDWDRLVRLLDADSEPATSLVPPGIPGAGEGDFSPAYDPDAARSELAAAGYRGGAGFPAVTLATQGSAYDEAIAREIEEVLGVKLTVEVVADDNYLERLSQDPPEMWALSWIADYPAPHDFLGLLLETGSSNNYSRWSHRAFDAALAEAGASADLAQQARRYAAAQQIVRTEVPVIPVSYGESWALSRTGLLGAAESGVGLIRFAGLAWAER